MTIDNTEVRTIVENLIERLVDWMDIAEKHDVRQGDQDAVDAGRALIEKMEDQDV